MTSFFKAFLATLFLLLFNVSAMAQYEIRLPLGAEEVDYNLIYSPWTTCDLWTASQERTAQCARSDTNELLTMNLCKEPVLAQSCLPDYTYTFSYGGWGVCDLWTATQQRPVGCYRDHDNLLVDNSSCGSPQDSQSCLPDYTYAFSYGSWGVCDIYTATQSRSASCQREHDGLAVTSSFCGTAVSQQACTPNYSYSFNYGDWSSCDLYSATQDRTASCLRNDGSTVDNSFCGTAVTTQGCTPAYSYSFNYTDWSTCSLQSATQTRSASCLRNDGVTVDSYVCGTATTTQSCTPDYSYSFNYGGWSSCDLYTATQSRTASCLRNDGSTVSNSFCGTPTTSQSCTPNYSYSLSYGSWGSCNASNVKTRTATCTRNDGANVSTSFCGSVTTSNACTLSISISSVKYKGYPYPSWYANGGVGYYVSIPGTNKLGLKIDNSHYAYGPAVGIHDGTIKLAWTEYSLNYQ